MISESNSKGNHKKNNVLRELNSQLRDRLSIHTKSNPILEFDQNLLNLSLSDSNSPKDSGQHQNTLEKDSAILEYLKQMVRSSRSPSSEGSTSPPDKFISRENPSRSRSAPRDISAERIQEEPEEEEQGEREVELEKITNRRNLLPNTTRENSRSTSRGRINNFIPKLQGKENFTARSQRHLPETARNKSNTSRSPICKSEVSKTDRFRSPVVSGRKVPYKAYVIDNQEIAYSALQKFYKSAVVEKKIPKDQALTTRRSEIERELFGHEKENFTPNKSGEGLDVNLVSTERKRAGTIKKQVALPAFRADDEICKLGCKYRNLKSVFSISKEDLDFAYSLRENKEPYHEVTSLCRKIFRSSKVALKKYVADPDFVKLNSYSYRQIVTVARWSPLQIIAHASKFENIDYIREINDNNEKLVKVKKAEFKLKRENHKLNEALKNQYQTPKKNYGQMSQPLKRTVILVKVIAQNEDKINLIQDIKSKMKHLNSFVALKYFASSTKVKGRLIDIMEKTYQISLLYHTFASLAYYRNYRYAKYSRYRTLNDYSCLRIQSTMLKYWKKYLLKKRQKNVLVRDLRNYYQEVVLKRGFFGLLRSGLYQKLEENDERIAFIYSLGARKTKVFSVLKNIKVFIGFFSNRSKSPGSLSSRNIDFETRNRIASVYLSTYETIIKTLKKKIAIPLSKREAYTAPLQKIKAIFVGEDTGPFRPEEAKPRQINQSGKIRNNGLLNSLGSENASFAKQHRLSSTNVSSAIENCLENHSFNDSKIERNSFQRFYHNQSSRQSVVNIHKELLLEVDALIRVQKSISKQAIISHLDWKSKQGISMKEASLIFAGRRLQRILSSHMKTWKIAYIEKIIMNKLSLYRALNVARLFITLIKKDIRETELEIYRSRLLRERTLLRKSFFGLNIKLEDSLNISKTQINAFRKKILFGAWIGVIQNRRKKEIIYGNLDMLYNLKTAKKAMKSWKIFIQTVRQTENDAKLLYLKKKFRSWEIQIEKNILLKRIFLDEFSEIKIKEKRLSIKKLRYFDIWKNQSKKLSALKLLFTLIQNNIKKCWDDLKNFQDPFFKGRKLQRAVKNNQKEPETYTPSQQKIIDFVATQRFFKRWLKYHYSPCEKFGHMYENMRIAKKSFCALLQNMLKERSKYEIIVRIDQLYETKIMRRCFEAMTKYEDFYRSRKRNTPRRVKEVFNKFSSFQSAIPARSDYNSFESQPLLSLFFNGWRSYARRSRNTKWIIKHYQETKNKEMMRKYLINWVKKFNQVANESIYKATPHFNKLEPRILSTEENQETSNESMSEKIGGRALTFGLNTMGDENKLPLRETFSASLANIPDPNEGFSKNADYWLELMKENEEFLKRMSENVPTKFAF